MSYEVTFRVDPTNSRTRPSELIQQRGASTGDAERTALARGLGWLSIGIGLSEVLAPRRLERGNGMREQQARLLTLMGLRELMSGAFFAVRSAGWKREELRETTHSIAVQKPLDEVYDSMHDLSMLPKVFPHLASVRVGADGRYRVRTQPLAGKQYEWALEITDAVRPERFSFCSVAGGAIEHSGVMVFKSLGDGRGTLVTVQLLSSPALGRASALGLSIALSHALKAGLRRWKQWMETGEIATTEGQPTGHRTTLGSVLP